MKPGDSEAVVAQARLWLRTPYHHAADVLGVGVDCAMMPVRVYGAVGLIPADIDPRPYPPDWHLHRDDERYLSWVTRYADKVPDGEPYQPGDLALFRFGRAVSHGGIIEVGGDDPMMIHADRDAGEVCREEVRRFADRLEGYWRMRA